MNRLKRKFWFLITQSFYKGRFRHIGKGSVLNQPLQLDCVKTISIGERVYIAEGAWLFSSGESAEALRIGDGTTIGHFSHIAAKESVMIGKDVLIADRVYISDAMHEYENVELPVLEQPVISSGPVTIGDDSWLGENVCIYGASVGRHCVIGANSVVIKDIPDYCVAAGIPARVIKRYNADTKTWDTVS